jgi:hypothetical protein
MEKHVIDGRTVSSLIAKIFCALWKFMAQC